MYFTGIKKATVQVLAFALVLILNTAAVGAAEIEVRFNTEVQVKGDKVFLAEVADISGPDCALTNDLGAIYITRAPRPGQSVNIRPNYLLRPSHQECGAAP